MDVKHVFILINELLIDILNPIYQVYFMTTFHLCCKDHILFIKYRAFTQVNIFDIFGLKSEY
jgi:hypothetical protein